MGDPSIFPSVPLHGRTGGTAKLGFGALPLFVAFGTVESPVIDMGHGRCWCGYGEKSTIDFFPHTLTFQRAHTHATQQATAPPPGGSPRWRTQSACRRHCPCSWRRKKMRMACSRSSTGTRVRFGWFFMFSWLLLYVFVYACVLLCQLTIRARAHMCTHTYTYMPWLIRVHHRRICCRPLGGHAACHVGLAPVRRYWGLCVGVCSVRN